MRRDDHDRPDILYFELSPACENCVHVNECACARVSRETVREQRAQEALQMHLDVVGLFRGPSRFYH